MRPSGRTDGKPLASFDQFDGRRYYKIEVSHDDELQDAILPHVIKRILLLAEAEGIDEVVVGGNQARKALMPSLKNTVSPVEKKRTRDVDVLFYVNGEILRIAEAKRREMQNVIGADFKLDVLSPFISRMALFSIDGLNISFKNKNDFSFDDVTLGSSEDGGETDFFERKLRVIRRDRPIHFFLIRFLKLAIKCRHFEIEGQTIDYFKTVPEYRVFVDALLNFLENRNLFDYHDNDNIVALMRKLDELTLVYRLQQGVKESIDAYFGSYFSGAVTGN